MNKIFLILQIVFIICGNLYSQNNPNSSDDLFNSEINKLLNSDQNQEDKDMSNSNDKLNLNNSTNNTDNSNTIIENDKNTSQNDFNNDIHNSLNDDNNKNKNVNSNNDIVSGDEINKAYELFENTKEKNIHSKNSFDNNAKSVEVVPDKVEENIYNKPRNKININKTQNQNNNEFITVNNDNDSKIKKVNDNYYIIIGCVIDDKSAEMMSNKYKQRINNKTISFIKRKYQDMDFINIAIGEFYSWQDADNLLHELKGIIPSDSYVYKHNSL
jgi:hypothetical protein